MRRLGPAALFCLFILLACVLVGELTRGVLAGTAAFLVYRWLVVREILCRHHRRGIRAVKDGHFVQALAHFEDSQRAWEGLVWLDRWRAPLMASAGRFPFAWLAQYNQGYCLARLGRRAEAIARLDALAQAHPSMTDARALADAQRAEAAALVAVGPSDAADFDF